MFKNIQNSSKNKKIFTWFQTEQEKEMKTKYCCVMETQQQNYYKTIIKHTNINTTM